MGARRRTLLLKIECWPSNSACVYAEAFSREVMSGGGLGIFLSSMASFLLFTSVGTAEPMQLWQSEMDSIVAYHHQQYGSCAPDSDLSCTSANPK